MATPINTFKTNTAALTTSLEMIYQAPAITSTIVLMAQVANVADAPANVTAMHYDPISDTYTELIKEFVVPPNDAVGVLVGKLVLTSGQQFYANASLDNHLKLTISLLETR